MCLNSLKYGEADKDKRCVESKYEKPSVRMIQHNGLKWTKEPRGTDLESSDKQNQEEFDHRYSPTKAIKISSSDEWYAIM